MQMKIYENLIRTQNCIDGLIKKKYMHNAQKIGINGMDLGI